MSVAPARCLLNWSDRSQYPMRPAPICPRRCGALLSPLREWQLPPTATPTVAICNVRLTSIPDIVSGPRHRPLSALLRHSRMQKLVARLVRGEAADVDRNQGCRREAKDI